MQTEYFQLSVKKAQILHKMMTSRENRDNFRVSRYEFFHMWRNEFHCNLSSFVQMLPSYKVIFVVINFSHFFPDSIKDKWNNNNKKSNRRKRRSNFWVNQLRNLKTNFSLTEKKSLRSLSYLPCVMITHPTCFLFHSHSHLMKIMNEFLSCWIFV